MIKMKLARFLVTYCLLSHTSGTYVARSSGVNVIEVDPNLVVDTTPSTSDPARTVEGLTSPRSHPSSPPSRGSGSSPRPGNPEVGQHSESPVRQVQKYELKGQSNHVSVSTRV